VGDGIRAVSVRERTVGAMLIVVETPGFDLLPGVLEEAN
jgi:hypothetical protein